MARLDKQEKDVLKSFEKGAWKSTKDVKEKIQKYSEYAKNTFAKDQRVNIRISAKDLEGIQKRAIEEGIPYQTLIASLIHKFLSGRLAEKA